MRYEIDGEDCKKFRKKGRKERQRTVYEGGMHRIKGKKIRSDGGLVRLLWLSHFYVF